MYILILPEDHNAGEPMDGGLARTMGWRAAPLRFGHQGGCASTQLGHTVDLQASRTKFIQSGLVSGFMNSTKPAELRCVIGAAQQKHCERS